MHEVILVNMAGTEFAGKKPHPAATAIIDTMGDGLIVTDLDGNIISVNRAMEEYLIESGADAKELVGKSAFDLPTVRQEDREKFVELMKEVIERERVSPLEFQDTAGRWGSIIVSLLKDQEGNPSALFAIRRDITELKRLQEKERKAEEEEMIRLSNAVKMSTDSIVISDIDAKIIDVNEATLKMYGTDDKKDLIGKNSFDIIAPEDREKAFVAMEEVLERGYHKGREYYIITKDGGKLPVEMTVALMKDKDGKPIGFVGISRDITKRKKEEEKRAADDKALIEKMEKFARLTNGREMRITELKRRVKELEKKLNAS